MTEEKIIFADHVERIFDVSREDAVSVMDKICDLAKFRFSKLGKFEDKNIDMECFFRCYVVTVCQIVLTSFCRSISSEMSQEEKKTFTFKITDLIVKELLK